MHPSPADGRHSRRRFLGMFGAAAVGAAVSITTQTPALAQRETTGGIRTGLDYSWSHPSPRGIRQAGHTFVNRYLSWDDTGKNLTRAEAEALQAAGVDIVCNWEYFARESLDGYAAGAGNAREALRQAREVGMPDDRPIYFSVDFDATEQDQIAIDAYFDGVISVLGVERVGAYSGYWPIKRLFDGGRIRWGWQTYGWSGGLWDSRVHLRQVRNGVKVDGADTDINHAMAVDFGQWGKRPKKSNFSSYLAPAALLASATTAASVIARRPS